MTAKPTVTLEVDDIQAPLLHPRPTHYAGAVILGRIDDRRDGRELLRRLIPFVPPLPAHWTRTGRPGPPWRSASRASRRWACPPTPSPASRRSFSRAWPRGRPSWATPARARPRTGSHRSGALTSTWRSTRWPRIPRARRRRSPAPATPCGRYPASRLSGCRTPTCCRTSEPR